MTYLELIKYSTIPLRKHDNEAMPSSFGSSFLLDLKGYRFLITAYHVPKESSKFSAQIKYNDRKGQMDVLHLNKFNYLTDNHEKKGVITNIDFAFHPVLPNFKCYYQAPGCMDDKKERPIFSKDDIENPNKKTCYGFSGDINHDVIPERSTFATDQLLYTRLKYDRTENNIHYFKLPENHPGHEIFEGCSGAPIIGEDGKIVSLLSGGSIENNEVYGCNLKICVDAISE